MGLGLSFNSMQQLYDKLEQLPYKAEWLQQEICLVEDPTEKHPIEYQNPIDAIKSLWADPLLADQLVYQPEKMYADESCNSRLYNEMWTGSWWWSIQVPSIFLS